MKYSEEEAEKMVNQGYAQRLEQKKERLPRIGFEITPEQHKELKRLIPWGVVTSLYQVITEDLLELMRNHGAGKILSAVLNRDIKFHEMSKTLNQNDSPTTETKLSQPQ